MNWLDNTQFFEFWGHLGTHRSDFQTAFQVPILMPDSGSVSFIHLNLLPVGMCTKQELETINLALFITYLTENPRGCLGQWRQQEIDIRYAGPLFQVSSSCHNVSVQGIHDFSQWSRIFHRTWSFL